MIYGLLGELEIGRDGEVLSLPGGHQLVVLAALLVNANRRMSKADLLRAAWGSDTVDAAQLHKATSALRDLLRQIGRDKDLLTHARFGYELRVADEDVDMLLFGRLIRKAEDARKQGRAGDEAALLRQALLLWRGRYPLSNVPAAAFQREITELEQRRKRAAVRLFDLEIGHGRYERAFDELVVVASCFPADRRLLEQLMVVAYRCGHATDAIAAYERHTAALVEERGGTPDPSLRTLYYAVANGAERPIAEAEAAIANRAGTSPEHRAAVPRQLPPDVADFVGRGDLLAEASWLLSREPGSTVPVVVISGPGGIGKTALALRAAHKLADHYPDGQLYVELRTAAGQPVDVIEVLDQFLRALGASVIPQTRTERLSMYRTLVADRRILVVLDDAVDGAQIRDLIPASPACGVLVTARRRLPDISGVHHVAPLEPLSQSAATDLFLRVVRRGGIDLPSEPDAVARVVTLCFGLPLAVRIAGALRVDNYTRSTSELADRLARQGHEGFAYEELSVARTIGVGFDHLHAGARRLFLELGLLQLPTFGLWTAAALLHGTDMDPAAALSQLAAGYMIQPVGSGSRYRFHDLTREYAGGRAVAAYPDEEYRREVIGRVYRALLTLTRRAHRRLYGGDFEVVRGDSVDWDGPAEAVDEVDTNAKEWFDTERLNIRAAIEHCATLGLAEIAWDMALTAQEFYAIGGYFDDWYATHTAAQRACVAAGDRRGEGMMLVGLGQPTLVASRRAGGVSGPRQLQRAVELLTEAQDRHGLAIALRTLANSLRRAGQLTRPLALFTEALAHFEDSGDTVGHWQALRFIGQTYLDLGNTTEALRVLRDAEKIAAGYAEGRVMAQTQYWIGQTHLLTGHLDDARDAFGAVAAVYPEPVGVGHAYAVHGLGDEARQRGAYAEAQAHLGLAARLAHEGADAVLEGRVYLSIAALSRAQGLVDGEVAALGIAAECFASCDAPYLQARAFSELGSAEAGRADPVAAQAAWSRVEELYAVMDLPEEDRIHRPPTETGLN